MQTQLSNTVIDTLHTAATGTAQWTHTGWNSVMAGKGIMITVVGILVVFVSLTLLTLLIRSVHRFATIRRITLLRHSPASPALPANGLSGELVTAIAVALHEHLFEVHDEEKTIITIQKVSKPYSPWSSKLYNMTKPPIHFTKQR